MKQKTLKNIDQGLGVAIKAVLIVMSIMLYVLTIITLWASTAASTPTDGTIVLASISLFLVLPVALIWAKFKIKTQMQKKQEK
jgi:hypothetical protein